MQHAETCQIGLLNLLSVHGSVSPIVLDVSCRLRLVAPVLQHNTLKMGEQSLSVLPRQLWTGHLSPQTRGGLLMVVGTAAIPSPQELLPICRPDKTCGG